MAEQQKKKYVDPNAFADYGAAMASVAGNPMAVEWQKAAEAQLAAATTPKALAAHVWDAASAEALLEAARRRRANLHPVYTSLRRLCYDVRRCKTAKKART